LVLFIMMGVFGLLFCDGLLFGFLFDWVIMDWLGLLLDLWFLIFNVN